MFHSGFFTNAPVQQALLVGGLAALVSGVTGVFTLLRGQSFAADALSHISSAGGSVALFFGLNTILGFLGITLLAAGVMEAVPVRRSAERDLVTGVVLGAGLGISALFLYLSVTLGSGGAPTAVLFGSLFTLPQTVIVPVIGAGLAALVLLGAICRPLFLMALDPDLAAVRNVKVRKVGLLHLVALALAVALAATTVGAILSTALLVAPAASAISATVRPVWSVLLAATIGLVGTWVGILVSYDSYAWTAGHAWPVSFCIVSILLLIHLCASFFSDRRRIPVASEDR